MALTIQLPFPTLGGHCIKIQNISQTLTSKRRFRRAAFLRMSRYLDSPVEAFELLRAIERRYGAIREYMFRKDYEVQTKYQCIAEVSFQNLESFERVPSRSEVITIPLPVVTKIRSGGIGLSEIRPSLNAQDLVENFESIPVFNKVIERVMEEKQKIKNEIEVRVSRSDKEFFSPKPIHFHLFDRNSRETARNFIRWGGFSDLRPIEACSAIEEGLLFQPSNVDHPAFRQVLRRYCYVLKTPNPYEVATSIEVVDVPWISLPGQSYAPTDTPMPSATDPDPTVSPSG